MDEAKRELVRNWLTKASHDLAAARLLAQGPPAVHDVATYHCQQAAEKALEGYLIYWNERVERTHDIGFLLARAMQIEPPFESWQDAADRLTPFATAYRDPGIEDQPGAEELEEAIDDADCIYRQVLAFLPSEVHPKG